MKLRLKTIIRAKEVTMAAVIDKNKIFGAKRSMFSARVPTMPSGRNSIGMKYTIDKVNVIRANRFFVSCIFNSITG